MSNNDKVTPHAEREERILALWKEKNTFQKSLDKDAPRGNFTFYDGPPFATGTPHYGHILAGTIKDVIPRFKTMQGFRVRRRWGWDCHGLPVENLVEKELGLKSKKDILNYGIGKFNAAARENVMRYADEWRRIIPRLGRWVDMENDYETMDPTYTETVWWIFKQLHDKGLIYEGFKSMNLCPHCETTLSNFEVAQGYKDITDISVYAKFELKGDAKTYFLAWTTTPWTLPGNVALAVNPSVEYVKIAIAEGDEQKKGQFILAKERLSALKDVKYEVLQTMQGSELVGMAYEPLFDYYSKNPSLKHRENGWKVYGADFVTTEDGTGIVHIAPAFGADDYDMSLTYNLLFVQHVAVDGTFKPEVTDFAGMKVKPKDTEEDKNAHQKSDIEVIKWLAHHGGLFDKEKLIHPYPHCWRCETPLLNYAASSWFVKVPEIKDKLIAENKKITWVPPEIGSARFGNWLEGARDWAISRTRFWGAPIPVWREVQNVSKGAPHSYPEKYHVMSSIEDLKKFSKAKNTYYVIRHGQAENNIDRIMSDDAKALVHLTAKGREEVLKAAQDSKDKNISFDLIFVSPFQRTQETAAILKEKLGWKDEQMIIDNRLHEMEVGSWNGKKVADFVKEFPVQGRFSHLPKDGETYVQIKKRMGDFLYETEKKYEGKTILIVTHGTPAMLLIAAAEALDRKQALSYEIEKYIANAEIRPLNFTPLPHNEEYELDLHRPFIDDIELKTPEGNKLVRVPDVFDCWFESGSMPYGESHYPFEHRDEFDPQPGFLKKSRGYPADFIAEGLDQTRGWFYSMLVLGVALFGRSPYKKVIVNGLVLAEDGEKMSKSKKNYPDPMLLVEKYGADSLRFYLMSSPVVRGQDLCFSEKGVDEVTKKVVNRLLNVVSFYEMYKDQDGHPSRLSSQPPKAVSNAYPDSENILDQWIISRLNETAATVTAGLEAGELDRAVRPFFDFTDDLSTWYLRRSRERFKGEDQEDKKSALNTTRYVLIQMATLMAPFMPFLAEDIYSRVGGPTESVHLDSWPSAGTVDSELLDSMKVLRDVASKGLEARMNAKMNVRQPLKTLRVKIQGIGGKTKTAARLQFIDLIKDEVNVKEVACGALIETDVELDTVLTPELKEEGDVRELVRKIQDLRKEKGLSVNDVAMLTIPADMKDLVSKYENEIKKSTKLSKIEVGETLALHA